MGLFTTSSPFDADVEKATSEMNTVEDWGMIMDICDKAKNANGAKDCLRSIVKRINHRVPFVSMQALTLLNACVNNCGKEFHLEICSRDFVSECRTLIGQKAHPRVAQKLKFMIKAWSEMKEFKDDPAMTLIASFYESLKKDGYDFMDPDAGPKKTVVISKDPNVVQSQQEEDDIAKAIAMSLQEDKAKLHKTTSLYPTSFTSTASSNSVPVAREVRKVRALYDFEAAEENELTFKAGELISVLDDSDPNWWKGFNQRGEGLFPANFATADLSVEPEETSRKVVFSEEVQVKTIEAPEQVEIDESKIDNVVELIQNADPTGEINPDSGEMLGLEEECKAMGPLIDAELETIDKKHADLCGINAKVLEALQMYHNLMKETPAPYGYKPMSYNTPSMGMSSSQQPAFNGSQYNMPQGQMLPGGQMSTGVQGQIPQMPQGQMAQGQGSTQGQMPQMMGQGQNYNGVPSQNFNNSAPAPVIQGQPSYPATSLPQQQQPHPQQNVVPSQSQNIPTPQNMNVVPAPQPQYVQQNVGQNEYVAPNMPAQTFYQQSITQQQLL